MRFWDFDNVIFDCGKDWSIKFLKTNINNRSLVADLPDVSHDILITGRNYKNAKYVKELLRVNHIRFKKLIFSKFTDEDYKSSNYLRMYYRWKRWQFIKESKGQIREEITAIDDDSKIISIAQRLSLNTFHVLKFDKKLFSNWKPSQEI
jgi:hypothetical protein